MTPSPKSPRASATAPRKSTRRSRPRASKGASPARRDAWITDPNALLAALDRANTAEAEPEVPAHPVEEMRHTSSLLDASLPEAPLHASPTRIAPHALSILRPNERVAHASAEGVVVIVRRRRAA